MSQEDNVSLKRIREAQATADKCRDAAALAKDIYKFRKEEHDAALKELQKIIRAETSEAPLFDRMSVVKEESPDASDEDAE